MTDDVWDIANDVWNMTDDVWDITDHLSDIMRDVRDMNRGTRNITSDIAKVTRGGKRHRGINPGRASANTIEVTSDVSFKGTTFMYMSQFSKRPVLRPVSHAKRHSTTVERHYSDVIFGPGATHDLDFTFLGDKKPRRSIFAPLKKVYHYLAGKKRSIF